MNNFEFQNTTKIIFGRGTENRVGKEVHNYADKILFHYGGGSIKKFGIYDKVMSSLAREGVEVIELGGVLPNPRISLVREGIDICRKEKIGFILAVGGGSVIDSAKAISIGVAYQGDVWDFYTGKAVFQEVIPVGVVLTIPAAGSESSTGSVITNEEGNLKRSLAKSGDPVRPRFAILNPEFTFTLPDYQTAAGAVDIMAHIMERYFTTSQQVDFTDRLCEATLSTMIKNTPAVLANPEDYGPRAEVMWAGTIAHNGLLGTGRVEDWASHMIEHELSGIYDVTHGAGLAVIIPAWMKYVYQSDIKRFARYANRVWDVEPDLQNAKKNALEGIRRTKEFFQSIGMPVSLHELNIPDDRLEEMAEKCTSGGSIGNFKKLNSEDVLKIYQLAR